MTSEDGDLYPITQEETQSKDKKTKSCYLPPSGGWFSGQNPPDPVAESREANGVAWFNRKRQKQQTNQRLVDASIKPSYPPSGGQFYR